MIRNEVALGLGIAVGVVVAGAAIYYISKKRASVKDQETLVSEKFAEKLKKSEKSVKSLKGILATQTYVEVLTTKELTNWFRENKVNYPENAQMIISIPTDDIIGGLGYTKDIDIDPDKSVFQLFYDGDNKNVLNIRMVSFAEIESNLQAHILEEDGMLIVKE